MLADRDGASWRRGSVGWRAGQWQTGAVRPGLPPEWQGSQSSEGATELGFPGPALGKMQSEAARRVGEPSGEGEEPPPEGLGGYDLLTQPEPRGPAGQQTLCASTCTASQAPLAAKRPEGR